MMFLLLGRFKSKLHILDDLLDLFLGEKLELFVLGRHSGHLESKSIDSLAWFPSAFSSKRDLNITSMLVAFNFSSMTCLRIVRACLDASFNVMFCKFRKIERYQQKDLTFKRKSLKSKKYLVVNVLDVLLSAL